MAFTIIMVAILVILILLGIVSIYLTRKYKRPVDYYSLFIIGITWMPLGFIVKNYFFSIMGLAFMGFGLANRDKWKTNRRRWKDLSREERILIRAVTIILFLLVLLGLVFLYLRNKGMV